MDTTQKNSDKLRNIVFGVEDSLVSTVGLISGIAVAGLPTKSVVLTGVVLIFVEAFSMAVGSLVSENSVAEYEAKSELAVGKGAKDAMTMFFSYLLAGFLVVIPYAIFSRGLAFASSIVLSLLALFALGVWTGTKAKIGLVKKGIQMTLLGGTAIALGIVVGKILEKFSL